jgi:DNA-directed RNA polymerase specialized sigma subunit
MLARKREQWSKDYELTKEARKNVKVQKFYDLFPYWDNVKDDNEKLPELCRIIIELYYGLGCERLTTTQIGEELPINGKPRTRQAIHLQLQKGLEILATLAPLTSNR